jgi:hypothetical protein
MRKLTAFLRMAERVPRYQNLTTRHILWWYDRPNRITQTTGPKVNEDFEREVWAELVICVSRPIVEGGHSSSSLSTIGEDKKLTDEVRVLYNIVNDRETIVGAARSVLEPAHWLRVESMRKGWAETQFFGWLLGHGKRKLFNAQDYRDVEKKFHHKLKFVHQCSLGKNTLLLAAIQPVLRGIWMKRQLLLGLSGPHISTAAKTRGGLRGIPTTKCG